MPETIDRGVDTARSCNWHFLCLRVLSVACICSGFVIIAPASTLEMGVGRFSRRLSGVGVLGMLDAGLYTTRRVEYLCKVPLGAGAL
jgi:hypothetical protein